MQFKDLQRKLVVWDNVLNDVLGKCKNEKEKKITSTSIDIKKMELLNNYLIEACMDSHLLTAIEQYSDLALKSVLELVKTYKSNS